MLDCKLTVRNWRSIADRVVQLALAREDGGMLPEWKPGDHIDIVLPDGMIRQYSLCGNVSDRGSYTVAVLDAVNGRGGSAYLCRQLAQGQTLGVRGPRSNFAFTASPSYIFIAGGIGITPIIPMIRQAEAQGAEWELHYGGRCRASMAFLDQLAVFGSRVTLLPEDECGLPDLATIVGDAKADTQIYCCGPEGLIGAVTERCRAWPKGSLHVERFAPIAREQSAPSGSFEVVLARSGLTLTVPPDKSILEVLTEAGVPALSACGEGTCGTCEKVVLEGIPDHRDLLFDEDERAAGDRILVCVSRSLTSRLVLDV